MITFEDKVSLILGSIQGHVEGCNVEVNLNFYEVESITYPNSHMTNFLQNLITNALKYRSKNRKCKINISTFRSENRTCICVEDNGIGINLKKYGNRIFGLCQKFHNVPNSKGLGLYILKTQLEFLDGKVEVESEVSKGFKFTLYLKDQA